MRHDLMTGAVATGPGRMGKASAAGALVASAGFALVLAARYACALDSAIALSYAQVKNDFLVLAGCVKADIPTNTAEDLHDDSKTNDHPATP
ncbi:hypothetical protein, partial [Paraburkholderia tagetis]